MAELPWQVIANNRGTVNKVVITDSLAEAAGWYLYLRKPLNSQHSYDFTCAASLARSLPI